MRIEICRQLYASAIVSFQVLFFSWNYGWPNTDFLQIHSAGIQFHGLRLTAEEASFVMTCSTIGVLTGCVLQSWLVDMIGQKRTILVLALPLTVGGWFTILAQNTYCIYAAHLFVGLGTGAASVIAPIFICEISSDRIRGVLNAIFVLAYSSGNAIGLLVRTFTEDYRRQVTYSFPVLALFALGFSFLPETPVFLRNNNRIKEADNSLKFYQGSKSSPEAAQFIMISTASPSCICSKDFFITPNVRKALVISIVMSAMPIVCGITVLFSYSAASSVELRPLLSFLVAIVVLVSNIITLSLVDLIRRKLLMIVSLVGAALGFFYLAFVNESPLSNTEVVPITVLLFIILIAHAGWLPISHIQKMDVLPLKFRSKMMMISQIFHWILSAIVANTHSHMIQHIQAYFIVFGCMCLICMLFVLIYVPETKGKSYRSIERLLEQ